jgi:hypothetical protein
VQDAVARQRALALLLLRLGRPRLRGAPLAQNRARQLRRQHANVALDRVVRVGDRANATLVVGDARAAAAASSLASSPS